MAPKNTDPSKSSNSPDVKRAKSLREGKYYKKRMSKDEKEQLSRKIIDKAVLHLEQAGELVEIGGAGDGSRALGAKLRGLFLLYTTPFSGFLDDRRPYGLDIWNPDGKIFSAWWEPFRLVCFKRGPWIDRLLDAPPARAGQHPAASFFAHSTPSLVTDAQSDASKGKSPAERPSFTPTVHTVEFRDTRILCSECDDEYWLRKADVADESKKWWLCPNGCNDVPLEEKPLRWDVGPNGPRLVR